MILEIDDMVVQLTKNKKNNDKKPEEMITEEKTEDKEDNTLEIKETLKDDKKEPEKPKTELEKAEEKIDELTDTLKRLQAEFENYKKRVDKDNKHMIEYSSANIISKILPSIDTFEIAIKDSCDAEKFREGVSLIYAELINTLKNEGLRKMDSLGKKFDPNYHDAMMAVETKDAEKDVVLEVLQEGYMLKNKVLRHSKVKISK